MSPSMSRLLSRLSVCLWLALVVCAAGVLISCGGGQAIPPSDPPTTEVTATKNPLVAQYAITWPYESLVMVEFGKDTSYGRTTNWQTLAAGQGTLNVQVAGMEASTTYHMRVHVSGRDFNWTDQDHIFATGPLPSVPFPILTVQRPVAPAGVHENPGVELLNLFGLGRMQSVVTDLNGNPIWYYDEGVSQGNGVWVTKPLPNGHMLLAIYETGGDSAIREIDLAGNTIRELDVNDLAARLHKEGFDLALGSFHHEVVPLKNGHVLALVYVTKKFVDLPGYPGSTTVLGDGIIDLDQDWNPVWTWSAFDHLDVNRHLAGLPDWTHGNAITPLHDGDLLLSLRHQAWILKIDYKNGSGSGDVLWKLGNGGDFALSGDDPSQWFYFQHFPSVVDEKGSLLTVAVFDNGNNRVLSLNGTTCGSLGAPRCYSRATIFDVDEDSRFALLRWASDTGYFSSWGGSIHQLSNENVEYDMSSAQDPAVPGSFSQVLEVTQTASPQLIWKMDIGGINAYRAYRIPSLYPDVVWSP